jgi:hypothetical protein
VISAVGSGEGVTSVVGVADGVISPVGVADGRSSPVGFGTAVAVGTAVGAFSEEVGEGVVSRSLRGSTVSPQAVRRLASSRSTINREIRCKGVRLGKRWLFIFSS